MVARIRTGSSIQGAIRYNENKVNEDSALLISAHRFSKAIDQLRFNDKLLRLEKLALLNERVKTNCLHVSLNFHPSENLPANKLSDIADSYMRGIGFGNQPYLVYQHFDAAHAHLHIVSTNIQNDGSRISFHNMGKTVSEKIRKEIEKDFNLVRASGRSENLDMAQQDLAKTEYGKLPTKRALSNIVTRVMEQYHFATLGEFNAILKCFGVAAYRGEKQSRMYQRGGLVYSLLNGKGERRGVPIKASAIYNRPTLKHLEEKFEMGRIAKKQCLSKTISQLDRLFAIKMNDSKGMQQVFQKHGISVIFSINEKGFLYGVTYVNHQDKCAFKGSELGKQYSATALRERLKIDGATKQLKSEKVDHSQGFACYSPEIEAPVLHGIILNTEILTAPASQLDYMPHALKRKRKKNKKLKLKS